MGFNYIVISIEALQKFNFNYNIKEINSEQFLFNSTVLLLIQKKTLYPQVESWMEESEDNRKIVDQINTLYIAVDTVNVMRKVDTEKALLS